MGIGAKLFYVEEVERIFDVAGVTLVVLYPVL
jgi:hypothetical protein